MKSFAWVSTVIGLSLALLAGVLMAAQAQGELTPLVHPAAAAAQARPATLRLSPALGLTQVYTTYQPLVLKDYPGDVLFADDFSDPASGWHVGEGTEVRWSYQSGEYEILISGGNYWAAVTAPYPGIDDYAFEFDVRREGGPDSFYGSIFGWSDWDHFYLFVVTPDLQYYAVFRRSGDDWLTVIDWQGSTHILPGAATNRLRVERSGSQLAVYANGSELASAVDGVYAGELSVGLYAEAGDHVPVATRYDNVLITRLASGGGAARRDEPAIAWSRPSSGGRATLGPAIGGGGSTD